VIIKDEGLRRLPEGWVWCELKELVLDAKQDIVDGPFGSNLKASEYVNSGIPIIRLQNIQRNKFVEKNIRYITPEKAQQLSRHSFSRNDIVLTKLGSPLGKACLIPDNIESGIIVADIVRVRTEDRFVNRKYLVYAINSDGVIRQLAKTRGTTRPRVNLTKVRKLKISLAPLNEQHHIVDEVEELFSKLDAAVESLHEIKVQLRRYRQAVLKHAFEGKLTEEWRKTCGIGVQEWEITQLINVCSSIKKGIFDISPSTYVEKGIPFLRISDIVGDRVNLENAVYLPEDIHKKEKKTELSAGDLVLSKVGTLNRVAVIPPYIETCNMSQNIIGIKVDKTRIDPNFLFYILKSRDTARKLLSSSHVTTLRAIRLKAVRELQIPLPSLLEQHEIADRLSNYFGFADEIEKIVERNLLQSERLRQSVLKKAFEGRLVPQEPSDEPAEKLLERIRKEKEKRKSKEIRQKSNRGSV